MHVIVSLFTVAFMVSESMQVQLFDSTKGNDVFSLHRRIHDLEQKQKEKDNKLAILEAALREKDQQLQELW
jgi:hypothetical protein